MEENLQSITKQFQVHGDLLSVKPYGSGHINDTYVAAFNQSGSSVRYILRRINHQVFKKPYKMMQNIERVTEHIRGKLLSQPGSDISRQVMTIVPTISGENIYRTDIGNYWTMFVFIENACTYDVLNDTQQAYEAAKMFGLFQTMLSDLPGDQLHETIVRFHDGPDRYQKFLTALYNDKANRAIIAKSEIKYLQQQANIFYILPGLVERGMVPVRITHNDTKLNNIMFDKETGRAICVIDLDTVMPGLSLYDFGDLVRTSVSPTEEDEQNISKIHVRLDVFEALVNGYLDGAGNFLNSVERDHLIIGGKMMTLIMATRFLTDYLEGDIYYKTHRPDHNLDRCRTQLKLLKCMNQKDDQMNEIVRKLNKG